jgi:hypothetical protein
MIKRIKAESEWRKGVRLGSTGGSLFNDWEWISTSAKKGLKKRWQDGRNE